jgi:hypothetical protein
MGWLALCRWHFCVVDRDTFFALDLEGTSVATAVDRITAPAWSLATDGAIAALARVSVSVSAVEGETDYAAVAGTC